MDITKVVNGLIDEGWEVDPIDLATVTPVHHQQDPPLRHLAPGTWHLGMEPSDGQVVGHLQLVA